MVDKLRKVHFKYLDYLFEDMYEVKSRKYPNSRFWKKDDEVILELEKSGSLYVLNSIWTNISNMLSLDYNETQLLVKDWVEQYLELEEVTPCTGSHQSILSVEQHLELEEVTPGSCLDGVLRMVEQHFIFDEVTPMNNQLGIAKMVEQHLKLWEITPRKVVNGSFDWVEEQLMVEQHLKLEEVTPRKVVNGSFDWVEEQTKQI